VLVELPDVRVLGVIDTIGAPVEVVIEQRIERPRCSSCGRSRGSRSARRRRSWICRASAVLLGWCGAGVVELERDLVVRVEAGGQDDVEFDLGGDLLDAGDVAAESKHGGIHDGVDPEVLQLTELRDRVRDLLVLVPVV
jgi:hypothetical protein